MKYYKYKSTLTIDRDLPLLENDRVWFSKVDSLNDPYEGMFKIGEGSKFALRTLFSNKKEIINKLFETRNNLAKVQNNMAGILSLTKEKDNLLMWSHYGENHKGYVIEYDFSEENFVPDGEHSKYKQKIELVKVEYTKKPRNQNIGSKIKFIQLRNKSKCWKYEKEYRFIASYFGLYKYNFKCLKAIYLGANASEETIMNLKNFCISKKISLYRAVIPSDSFELTFIKLI